MLGGKCSVKMQMCLKVEIRMIRHKISACISPHRVGGQMGRVGLIRSPERRTRGRAGAGVVFFASEVRTAALEELEKQMFGK